MYELEIPWVNEDSDDSGDYDIRDSVRIVGAGATTAILDGGFPIDGITPEQKGMDRLFEIHPTAGNVTFADLTLREAFSPDDGGAIQNWSPGPLRIEHVHVLDNLASGVGGGINNDEPYRLRLGHLCPPLLMPGRAARDRRLHPDRQRRGRRRRGDQQRRLRAPSPSPTARSSITRRR